MVRGGGGVLAQAGRDPELDDMGGGEVELVRVTMSGSAKRRRVYSEEAVEEHGAALEKGGTK